MLLSLAKQVSHTTLPEAFYKDCTFTEDPNCEELNPKTEEMSTLELVQRVKELKKTGEATEDDDEDE